MLANWIKIVLKFTLLRSILTLLIVGVLLAAMVLMVDMRRFLVTPLNIPDSGLTIELPAGSSIHTLITQLQAAGALRQSRYLLAYARITGKASRLKAGEYAFKKGMLPREAVDLIVDGKVIQRSFTIVEGITFAQLRKNIAADTRLKHTLAAHTDAQIMQAIGMEGIPAEGRFFPDTYLFSKGYTDLELLARSAQAMNAALNNAWRNRAAGLPINSMDELLTLASIIEKETAVARERAIIAGVFVRRLNKKMRLQTDPTVVYGLGEQYKGTLTRTHLQTDTPYNTYTRAGLPPTPIALPGRDALLAAALPAAGTSLYFVAKGDRSGEHVFSDTLSEHDRAVKQYRARIAAP